MVPSSPSDCRPPPRAFTMRPMPSPALAPELASRSPFDFGKHTSPLRPQRQSLAWWYYALIDDMIAYPERRQYEHAKRFGVSANTISLVAGSDLFKMKLAERRREFEDRQDRVLTNRLHAVAAKSLGIIEQALEEKQTAVALPILADIANKTLDRLGYGAPIAPGVQVNLNQDNRSVSVSVEDLAAARAALRASEAARLVEPVGGAMLPLRGEVMPSEHVRCPVGTLSDEDRGGGWPVVEGAPHSAGFEALPSLPEGDDA